MALLGIESLIYGVDDLDTAARFYEDFGLKLHERSPAIARFVLPEGSSFILRRSDDASLPPRFLKGQGPREVIWGVDNKESLAAIAANLKADRDVASDGDGTLHTVDDSGLRIGFRIFERKPLDIAGAPPENNLAEVRRWNRHRKWFDRAHPKLINHVVFGVADVDRAVAFYTERLQFRVTDILRGIGVFMRCDGRHDHHNLFFLRGPMTFFSHVSFGVENIDELMIGALHMQQHGWVSEQGLGRHRISSLVFWYMNSPAGGQTEYSADSDYLDDAWKPRLWNAEFGQHHWLAVVPQNAHLSNEGTAEVIQGTIPKLAETIR